MGRKKKATVVKEVAVESLRQWTDGHEVDLSNQERQEAPVAALEAAPLLTRVDLSGNLMAVLPDDFGSRLSHLVHLSLARNRLTELPASIGALSSLRKLDLFENQLIRLPYQFAELRSLRWLDIKANPIKEGFLSPATIGECSTDDECRACASRVIARVGELWGKRRKEDERLARKQEREAAAAREVANARKAEEKAARRAAWIEQQAAESAAKTKQREVAAAAEIEEAINAAEKSADEVPALDWSGWRTMLILVLVASLALAVALFRFREQSLGPAF